MSDQSQEASRAGESDAPGVAAPQTGIRREQGGESTIHVGGEPGTAGAYDVVVGSGIAERVGDLVPASVARALLVHAAPVADLAGRLEGTV